MQVSEQDLLKWDPRTMRFSERNFSVNHLLNCIDKKFQDFLIFTVTTLSKFNRSEIRDHIFENEEKIKVTVTDFVDEYYEKSVLYNSELNKGTVRNYKKSIKHLKNFLQFRQSSRLLLKDFGSGIAIEFKDYLLATFPGSNRIGMSEVSAACTIKKLKTIFSRAVDINIIDKNPFRVLKLRNRSARRERLRVHHMKKLLESLTGATSWPAYK